MTKKTRESLRRRGELMKQRSILGTVTPWPEVETLNAQDSQGQGQRQGQGQAQVQEQAQMVGEWEQDHNEAAAD